MKFSGDPDSFVLLALDEPPVETGQCLFCLLACRDVHRDTQHALRATIGSIEVTPARSQPVYGLIPPDHAKLMIELPVAPLGAIQGSAQPDTILGMHTIPEGFERAGGFVVGQSQQFMRLPEPDIPSRLEVEFPTANVSGVHGELPTLAGLDETVFRQLSFGHIDAGSDVTGEGTIEMKPGNAVV